MENLFRRALKEIRAENQVKKSTSFGRLFLENTTGWHFIKAKDESLGKTNEQHPVSEKSIILDSFKSYLNENLEKNNGTPVKVKGGEIAQKIDKKNAAFLNSSKIFIDLIKEEEEILGKKATHLRFKDKKETKVFFIFDKFNHEEIESESDLSCVLPSSLIPFFEKMISALKLQPSEYFVSAIKYEDHNKEQFSFSDYLVHELHEFKPKLIFTFGAQAPNFLLNKNERLMNIRGNFYGLMATKGEEEFQVDFLPLLHPSVIVASVDHKRIVWEDMQKGMKLLGLI